MFRINSIANCPYCQKAKDLLKEQELDFKEIKVKPEEKQKYKDIVGLNTFPQVYFNDFLIGGYTELVNLLGIAEYLENKDYPTELVLQIRNELYRD